MAENGYGGPVTGHYGRIPNYGKTQVNPMGTVEPPACIQNAMMTKDKKPFTYTPGGLDLSQIKTPSMARRMARQRSLEEQEQAYGQAHPGAGGYHQPAAMPPPPPPPQAPAPPPPPPLVIEAPNSKSPNPIAGERPEIVIPEDPIRMLRKTNSPYHWEAEKAEMQRMGPVPKFQEKVPSPLTVQMAPSSFSQQPPQAYSPAGQNNFQRQNHPYGNQNAQAPDSPIHRPEAQYAHQKPASPNVGGSPVSRELLQRQDSQFNKSPQPFSGQSPLGNGSPYSPTHNNNWRQPERRDSPALAAGPQSPSNNRNQVSPNTQQYSPNYQNQQNYQPSYPNQIGYQNQPSYPNQSSYQNQPSYPNQPSFQNKPSNNNQLSYQNQPNYQNQLSYQNQPNHQNQQNFQNQTPPNSGPAAFHTLPRSAPRAQDNNVNSNLQNNTREGPLSPKGNASTPAPAAWRSNTLNRNLPRETENPQSIYHNSQPLNQQPTYTPPWKTANTNTNNAKPENVNAPQWRQENKNAGNQHQQHNTQWAGQDANNNKSQEEYIPPWKAQANEKKQAATPQPTEQPRYQSSMTIPVSPKKQNPPEQNNNVQREVVFVNQEPVYYCPESPKAIPPWVKSQKEKTKTPPPEWVQRPLERKSVPRELVTPPRDSNQEPEWVKKSNEMQRNLREVISPPKYSQPVQPTWSTVPSENRKSLPKDNAPSTPGSRVIPIHIESNQGGQGNQAPVLRISINTQSPNVVQGQAPLSQPTQRIMRVLSPQLVRMDDGPAHTELPTLNKNLNGSQESQAKTRIIPIQIEGGNGGSNKRVYYHKFSQDPPPRQSKAFRVLQIITGTQDQDHIQNVEQNHGFSDL